MGKKNEATNRDVELYWASRRLSSNMESRDAFEKQFSSRHAYRCIKIFLSNKALASEFDHVLSTHALRHGWSFSQWHKYARYSEKIMHYVKRIRSDWETIIPSNEERNQLEPGDVKALEGRCPKYCKQDQEDILKSMSQGKIFKGFSPQDRQTILQSANRIDHNVTSLFTLLEDLHFLDQCAMSFDHLMPFPRCLSGGQPFTIEGLLRQYFKEDREGVGRTLQVAHDRYWNIPATVANQFELVQRALWLFVMRNFKLLARPRRRDGRPLLAKVESAEAQESTLADFATLASLLGFQSAQIDGLKRQNMSFPAGPATGCSVREVPKRRYGTPFDDAFEQDRKLLFLDTLHRDDAELEYGTFFALKSFYMAFFGEGQLHRFMWLPDQCSTTPIFKTRLEDNQDRERPVDLLSDSMSLYGTESMASAPSIPQIEVHQISAVQSSPDSSTPKAAKRGENESTFRFLFWERSQCKPTNKIRYSLAEEKAEGLQRIGLHLFSITNNPKVIGPSQVIEEAEASGIGAVLVSKDHTIDLVAVSKQVNPSMWSSNQGQGGETEPLPGSMASREGLQPGWSSTTANLMTHDPPRLNSGLSFDSTSSRKRKEFHAAPGEQSPMMAEFRQTKRQSYALHSPVAIRFLLWESSILKPTEIDYLEAEEKADTLQRDGLHLFSLANGIKAIEPSQVIREAEASGVMAILLLSSVDIDRNLRAAVDEYQKEHWRPVSSAYAPSESTL